MSKRVQLLGHIAEIAAGFLGLERELTVDTDNAELRLHDGVTEGGRRFLDRDANDNRYQGRSVELDGLLGWEPQERGFTVRLGPSDYRLRTIIVDTDNLEIENANGYSGNPALALAGVITSNHRVDGLWEFTEALDASGGVVGNLVGDVTGNLTGNVTGNLTGDAAGDHTGTFTGDVDVSGHGLAMADGQILLAWLEDAITDLIANSGVPIGTVVAYSGDEENIPDNWALCDGSGGTPDLRDRFIMGAGPTYATDSTGGSTNHSHVLTVESAGAHTHTGTVADHTLTVEEMPSHRHNSGVADNIVDDAYVYGGVAAAATTDRSIETGSADGVFDGQTGLSGGGEGHSHDLTVNSGGSHAHTASSANGSSLSPYYALAYIRKESI